MDFQTSSLGNELSFSIGDLKRIDHDAFLPV